MGKAAKKSSIDTKDAYDIAKDAVEDAAGREPKRHKALLAEATKLTRMGYQKDPTVRVPAQLREFIQFTEATVRREFMAYASDSMSRVITFKVRSTGWTAFDVQTQVFNDVVSAAPVEQIDGVTFTTSVDSDRALREVNNALDEHPAVVSVSYGAADDIVVKIDNDNTSATVEWGRREYKVWRDESNAEAYARERVLEDLKYRLRHHRLRGRHREIFNQSFLENHIDMKKLAYIVEQDAKEDGHIDDLDSSDLRRMAKMYNIDMEDDDGEDRDEDDVREDVRDAYAADMAKDPMSRMEEMLGKDDALKWAIEHAGIDYESAVDQAIRDDGWIHFVSSYDGEYANSPVLDYVIYRIN